MKAIVSHRSDLKVLWLSAVLVLATLLIATWTAVAAKPLPVAATGTYLSVDWGQSAATLSGRVHTTGMMAIVMVDSDNPLFQGRLTWWGNANTDTTLTGVCHGFGTIDLGDWDKTQIDPETGLFLFRPTGGHWVTKFEVTGNFASGPYEGIVTAHGVGGPIEGMVAILPFTGGFGTDSYVGQYVVPGK